MKDLPPFYIGQRVLCVDENPKARTNFIYQEEIFLGKEYVVEDCGYYGGLYTQYWYIKVGGMRTIWDVKSFIPIQENFQSISLEKVLEIETPLISVN